MRAVLQRVREGRVLVAGEVVGQIRRGLVVLVGVGSADTGADAGWLAAKVTDLRVFADGAGKFAHSVIEIGGAVLAIPQFTLYADASKGRRPSFAEAAPPAQAEALYEEFVAVVRHRVLDVETGRFGAHMEVEIVNDGPVTIWLDSRQR